MLPTTRILIFKSNLLHNLAQFKNAAGVPIAPVIKSNAYGHGLELVGKFLDTTDVPFLCVTSHDEAIALRAAKIRKPILVVGYTQPQIIRASKLPRCSYMIGTLQDLKELKSVGATIHLKIDTGMRRHGIPYNELDAAIQHIATSRLNLEGVMSHLSDADGKTDAYTNMQIHAWNSASHRVRQEFPKLKYWHLAATTGIRLSKKIEANVARLGEGLWGMNASHEKLKLLPALEMRSLIASLRTLKKGERIGYNGTFAAKKHLLVATVPVGYFEGIDRRLSNNGFFLVNEKPCPILGRVSMNITSIDVTDIPKVKLQDEVVVMSSQASDPNSVENIASRCGTIPYEILAHIPAHIPRIIRESSR